MAGITGSLSAEYSLYLEKHYKVQQWKMNHLFHFIPAIFYTLNYFSYIFPSLSLKPLMLKYPFTHSMMIYTDQIGLWGNNSHAIAKRSVFILFEIYMAISLIQLIKKKAYRAFRNSNRALVIGFKLMIPCILLQLLVPVISHHYGISINSRSWQMGTIVFWVNSIFYCFFICNDICLFYENKFNIAGRPQEAFSVQRQQNQLFQHNQLIKNEELDSKTAATTIFYSEIELAEIERKLHQELETNNLFLNPDLTVAELSKKMDLSPLLLSKYLNNYKSIGFNELINQYRVKYAIQQWKERDEWQQLTLEAIALKTGFNNRFTFINGFKKVTGETPSAFLRKMRP